MSTDRLTHPLRLARGSHCPGSGKGCAMSVISYMRGDYRVSEFPSGCARPLSLLVQKTNDLLAEDHGYLSPANAKIALELAWDTVDTADASGTAIHAWLEAALTDSIWGIAQYVHLTHLKSVLDVAVLHRQAACGDMPLTMYWQQAQRALDAAAEHTNPAQAHAMQTASQSIRFARDGDIASLDEMMFYLFKTHTTARRRAQPQQFADVTREAINAWHSRIDRTSPAAAPQPWRMYNTTQPAHADLKPPTKEMQAVLTRQSRAA